MGPGMSVPLSHAGCHDDKTEMHYKSVCFCTFPKIYLVDDPAYSGVASEKLTEPIKKTGSSSNNIIGGGGAAAVAAY